MCTSRIFVCDIGCDERRKVSGGISDGDHVRTEQNGPADVSKSSWLYFTPWYGSLLLPGASVSVAITDHDGVVHRRQAAFMMVSCCVIGQALVDFVLLLSCDGIADLSVVDRMVQAAPASPFIFATHPLNNGNPVCVVEGSLHV